METVTEVREDHAEEIVESSWPAKADYDWAAADVRNQSSLFRWSRRLNSWLNCTPVIAKGVDRGIVSLEWVTLLSTSAMANKELPNFFSHVFVSLFSVTCEVVAR